MKTRKIIIFLFVVLGVSCLFPILPALAAGTTTTQAVPVTSYELDSGDTYKYSKEDPVTVMSYGKASIGTLNVTGNILETTTYSGLKAYGVSGNVAFSYTYDTSIVGAPENQWHIIDDKEKKVNGVKLDSYILSGALIIQKSYDGENYEEAVNPVLDFFNSSTSGVTLYKTAGEDISQGVYLKFILVYKTARKNDDSHWYTPWSWSDSHRHMEVYDFYIVEDSGTISIHNLSNDEEILYEDEYTQELLKHGETLTNNSVTRDGFSIEKITSSYTVSVAKNSETARDVQNGTRFISDGKYTITVTTQLGKKYTTTIYVFGGGTDKGYSTYFGNGLVQAERVFRDGDFPTYAKGGQISINSISNNIPVLQGTLTDAATGKEVFKLSGARTRQTFSLSPGEYVADFYTGNPEAAGSIYRYTFIFSVLDEESAPYVNYHNLITADRLEDLQSKHYEVTYQTTGGGYVYVCFSLDSYENALRYAREIEGRFVEKASNGGFYYKSEENPNRKVKYYDEIELTRIRENYAKQNVEINYFNALDAFTYQTYDNNLLECLEQLSLTESIKVFPSQAEKEKLFDRTPYINNFTFIQATEYDVVKVEAVCEADGQTYELNFGTPVSRQLTVSSLYHITETNSYGKTTTYDAYFISGCQTVMAWNVTKDGVETSRTIALSDDGIVIEADTAYVSDIGNDLDDWAIVTIKAPDVYSFEIKCLASEFKNLEFTKPGTYEIEFIDRLGNSYNIKLVISGEAAHSDMKPFTVSYATFYNNLYLNQKDTREDIYALSEISNTTEDFDYNVYTNSVSPEETPNEPSEETSADALTDAEEKRTIPAGVLAIAVAVLVISIIVFYRKHTKNNSVV